jgi:hypothetical protein
MAISPQYLSGVVGSGLENGLIGHEFNSYSMADFFKPMVAATVLEMRG